MFLFIGAPLAGAGWYALGGAFVLLGLIAMFVAFVMNNDNQKKIRQARRVAQQMTKNVSSRISSSPADYHSGPCDLNTLRSNTRNRQGPLQELQYAQLRNSQPLQQLRGKSLTSG